MIRAAVPKSNGTTLVINWEQDSAGDNPLTAHELLIKELWVKNQIYETALEELSKNHNYSSIGINDIIQKALKDAKNV